LPTNLVGDLGSQPLLVNHLLPDIGPRHLVKLVDGRGDGTNEVLGHTANLEKTVEDLPRVELDGVLPLPPKALEDLIDDPDLVELLEWREGRLDDQDRGTRIAPKR
jgi:hypothetical protein